MTTHIAQDSFCESVIMQLYFNVNMKIPGFAKMENFVVYVLPFLYLSTVNSQMLLPETCSIKRTQDILNSHSEKISVLEQKTDSIGKYKDGMMWLS